MLTPSDHHKINNFKDLNPNHQRVFKHRLIKKCKASIKDLKYVSLNYEKLNLKIDKIIDTEELSDLIEIYENLMILQNK